MPDGPDGVAITDGGRRVLLKWHKLRRRPEEPAFSIANLRAGLAAGASLEVDVRLLGDGAWVCLHDDVLDEETDGSGPLGLADTGAIRRLRIARGDYSPPLLADLAEVVRAAPPSAACLQFDLKEPLSGLTETAIAGFRRMIAPVADRCLLSGTDWAAARKLGGGIAGLRLGYDPLDLAEGRSLPDAGSVSAFVEEVVATAPGADAYYVDFRFVMKALRHGINPVRRLKAANATVDIWTLDPTTPDIENVLPQMVGTGADQITTNAPEAMALLWARLRRGKKP